MFQAAAAQTSLKNALTIDVEDWYHCLDQEPANWSRYQDRIVAPVRELLELFEAASTKATFFVLGHVAERHPELIREIHDAGHEIASHGCEHRFIYNQTPEAFEADVGRSVRLLREITGADTIAGYRAPYFSITSKSLWALPILRKLGFAYDSSVFPVVNHRYGIPGAPRLPHETSEGLIEVPPSTFPLGKMDLPCAGGVYFRVLPLRMLAGMFSRLNARGERVIFYLHPWEIDDGQPRIKLPPFLRVRHYWGLRRCTGKLRRLLSEFRFAPVREVLGL